MKKILGLTMTLAAFPMMCIGGDYEIMFKLAAVAMLGIGAWMADLFDKEQPQAAAEGDGYSKSDDHNPYPEE